MGTFFKKTVLSLLVFVILIAGIGSYIAYKYRNRAKTPQVQTKAPETTLRFLEGWNIQEIADYLAEDNNRDNLKTIVKASDFIAAQKKFPKSDYPLLASIPPNFGLEGFLFPDSYRFYTSSLNSQNNSAQDISNEIIAKMLDNFSQKFTPDMVLQAKAKNLSVYQAVTLASIIEKETTGDWEEKRIIAGIFYNRLGLGMPLQSDATVNYATKKNLPSPTNQDLETNSPYNTYKYPGLPPGPICSPSLLSLKAALDPASTKYLYFLHDQKTGKAIYAETFEQHVANKFKYLK